MIFLYNVFIQCPNLYRGKLTLIFIYHTKFHNLYIKLFNKYPSIFLYIKLKKKLFFFKNILNEEFGLVTKDGCPKGISKIQRNFYFLNTVLEEQFCVGCADTKFHTIFHH